jgi:hypothetical protein
VADAVAIVSIVSGATVAIAVPFINAVLERQRLQWQGNQSRLDELRTVVDATLGEMVRANELLYDLASPGYSRAPDAPPKRELALELTQRYESVKTLGTRIGLRVGSEDPIARAHGKVLSILANAEVIVVGAVSSKDEETPSELWKSHSALGMSIHEFQEVVRDLLGPIRPTR